MAKKETRASESRPQNWQIATVLLFTLVVVAAHFLVGVLEAEPAIDNVYTAVTVLSVLTILFAVVVYLKYTGKIQPGLTSYESLLNLGIVFFIIGLATGNSTFWILGLIYMISGYSGKKRGGRPPTEEEKKMFLGISIVFFALFVLGTLVFFLVG